MRFTTFLLFYNVTAKRNFSEKKTSLLYIKIKKIAQQLTLFQYSGHKMVLMFYISSEQDDTHFIYCSVINIVRGQVCKRDANCSRSRPLLLSSRRDTDEKRHSHFVWMCIHLFRGTHGSDFNRTPQPTALRWTYWWRGSSNWQFPSVMISRSCDDCTMRIIFILEVTSFVLINSFVCQSV